ncbi:MAG TPA: PhzF family phenazine biosynthesis protein [Thermoanaerobaculia bacterium]|nr:PhzF family phenazine biosynthesis protein [Thermoanaerobaculia bacterium]
MRLIQVDAFTSEPFRGNPAAVCFLDQERDDAWMRNVAAEMNLAETAFLLPRGDGWSLRWFTPAVEVKLCGHATLGSAHALWEEGRLGANDVARFHTLSGELTAARDGEWIELDFPAKPAQETAAPVGLLESLGVEHPRYVGRNEFDYLVEVESEDEVRALKPDLARLAEIPVRGVIVTSKAATHGVDFVSRFFAPAVGVPEDPVTGSAHCCLTPFWSARLDKTEMRALQVSARGGELRVRLDGDRVKLSGQAVTTLRGELAHA